MPDASLFARPLELPCGVRLPNRLAKAAMAEGLGGPGSAPTEALERLYARLADGGAGLLITGNVMVDRRAYSERDDVAIEDDRHLAALTRWANSATSRGAHIWMQINHPGRQAISPEPVAPSAVPLAMGRGVFKTPRALEASEIEALVARFGVAAATACAAGFSGVQLHAAHGYLVSQFLSPRTNLRTDAWGGPLEGRMRFLIAVVRAMREAVGPGFPVGVKLNSADFQRGGFDEDESIAVVRALEAEGVDLLEISGGTYERAAMMGAKATASTQAREAYFLAYAEKAREAVKMPLMLTGGFRSASGMAEALGTGAVDVIGLARPLAQEPDLPARLLAGEPVESQVVPRRVGIRTLDGLVELMWYQRQLQHMGAGREPDAHLSPWWVLATQGLTLGAAAFRPRRG